jgi:hypothetical protein
MGKALKCAMAYEVCDWDTTGFNGLTPGEITTAFANASEWAMHSDAEMISIGLRRSRPEQPVRQGWHLRQRVPVWELGHCE